MQKYLAEAAFRDAETGGGIYRTITPVADILHVADGLPPTGSVDSEIFRTEPSIVFDHGKRRRLDYNDRL